MIENLDNWWSFTSDWGITVKEFVEYVAGPCIILRKQSLTYLRTQPSETTAVMSSLATGTASKSTMGICVRKIQSR
jgi:hypothetical protein